MTINLLETLWSGGASSGVPLAWCALSWAAYALLHSLLATLGLKQRLSQWRPSLAKYYRLAYVLIALLTLLPPLTLMNLAAGAPLWQWPRPWNLLADGLALAALAGFVWSFRFHDMKAFLGISTAFSRTVVDSPPSSPPADGASPSGAMPLPGALAEPEPLVISPLHRHVRHPWYALALVMIWSREMDAAHLVSALCWSLYFLIGIPLEERRLVLAFGAAYQSYREKVPALIPLPWRSLSPKEARELLSQAPLSASKLT